MKPPIRAGFDEAQLISKGYTRYNDKTDWDVHDFLYQKRRALGYHLNIKFYYYNPPSWPKAEYGVMADAQLHTMQGQTFNVELFIDNDTTLADVEMFFNGIFENMNCIVPKEQ